MLHAIRVPLRIRRPGPSRSAVALAGLAAIWATGAVVNAQDGAATPAEGPSDKSAAIEPASVAPSPEALPEALSEALATWLEEVDALITIAERKAFLALPRNYQREAFIRQFWRVRDPFPRTTRNELKERWPTRLATARSRFDSLDEDRARVLLLHDEPAGILSVRCTTTRIPAEAWFYRGSDQADFPFALLFVRPSSGAPMRLWHPASGGGLLAAAQRSRACINGSRLLQVLASLMADPENYANILDRVLAKPKPRTEEWIHSFAARTTEMPAGATPIEATIGFSFLGRYQQRTVVQGLIAIDPAQIRTSTFAGFRTRDLRLVGEVLVGDELFESFRYTFGFPADRESPTSDDAGAPQPTPLAVAFERFLRPGVYRIVLRLDDLAGDGVLRIEREITVPEMDRAASPRRTEDPLTAQLFAEAIAAVASGETTLSIRQPQSTLLTGFARFDVLTSGDEIAKVRFLLDDKPVVTRNRPPWNVGVDLGPYPGLHVLRAEGLDAAGAEVAADEILINGGGSRFAIKLIEPRRDRVYDESLRVRFEVELPEGRSLDRVELFLDEHRVATLYQPPFVHPLQLPTSAPPTYVRAVAYLADENTTEDLVFLGRAAFAEAVDVQMVELYTTVLDEAGRPVEGLTRSDFTVREDGVPQEVRRFETVRDRPIHVGVMIDNSASMHDVLSDVRKAALTFFRDAIEPRDRAALITFNRFPNLAAGLTSDRSTLAGGLAGLVAEGGTALYDSLMFALYYFTGIHGQRALLVLSDGKDESSRFDFDATLDYARRSGITVYTIGLRLSDGGSRGKLARLADETGGRSFFLRKIDELEAVYATIQRELRSQYLVTYQSTNTEDDETFRTVSLEVGRPDVEVKTLSGYYP